MEVRGRKKRLRDRCAPILAGRRIGLKISHQLSRAAEQSPLPHQYIYDESTMSLMTEQLSPKYNCYVPFFEIKFVNALLSLISICL